VLIIITAIASSLKVAGSIPYKVSTFFNLPNPSSYSIFLGLTRPVTETSTMNLPGGKARPALKADNLIGICEPTVWRMSDP
jgi:hypothetical protein